jgi:hypothetical protein
MTAHFIVHNPTQYRFKDFVIKCTNFAASGTEIDWSTRILYEVVEPNSTKGFPQINMGLILDQVVQSSCEITDLTVVEQPGTGANPKGSSASVPNTKQGAEDHSGSTPM